MKKRLLALLLSMAMVAMPTMTAFAEEVAVEETSIEETTSETTEDAAEAPGEEVVDEEAVVEETTEAAEETVAEETAEEVVEDDIEFEETLSDDALNAKNASGSFGGGVNWSVSGSTLTISGKGAMPDYLNDFTQYDGWNTYLDAANGVTKIVVAEGVTGISDYAFSAVEAPQFANVSSVELPSTLKELGAFSFKGNEKLTSVYVKSGNIQEGAFILCKNLQEVRIGSGVTYIGISAFESCKSINKVVADDLTAWCNIYFGGIKANPTEVSHNLYVGNDLVTELTIPSGVTAISDYAFQGVTSITRLVVPASVASIGAYAFHGCDNLEFISIEGNGLKSIGAFAFAPVQHVNSVKDLTLPTSMEFIGEYAFNGQQLQSLSVPNGHIGDYAFQANALMFAALGENVTYEPHSFAMLDTMVLRHDIIGCDNTVHNTVTFGNYNGEAINWRILTVENGKALLLSDQVLDYQKFNNEASGRAHDWASSDIRTWLNGTFYNAAFGGVADKIIATDVSGTKNPKYGTTAGGSSKDKVFLLSWDELNQYLPTDDARVASVSNAYANDGSRFSGVRSDKASYYWLRTAGINSKYEMFVEYDGNPSYAGAYSGNPGIFGVRPAIWVDASVVGNTAATRSDHVEGITSTNPAKDIFSFVERIYIIGLGRTPDFSGWMNWETGLENGAFEGAACAAGMLDSQEMHNRGLSNEDFVEVCYRVMMNRPSDPAGKQDWVDALDSGVQYLGVIKGFAESQEFTQICNDYHINRGNVDVTDPRDVNRGVTRFVARCYTKTLGRAYEDGGLINWCNYINNSENPREAALAVSTGTFFHGEEFMNKNTSDEEYVEILYETFLGRASDPVGKADWLNRLANGATRDDLLMGVAGSQEYDEIMKSYGL